MDITATMVKELRDRTGAGMMDAKKALVEVDGDMFDGLDVDCIVNFPDCGIMREGVRGYLMPFFLIFAKLISHFRFSLQICGNGCESYFDSAAVANIFNCLNSLYAVSVVINDCHNRCR